jgi:hypothetical protein
MGLDDGLITGEWCSSLDGLDTVPNEAREAHAVFFEEAFEPGLAGTLDCCQRGPLPKEVAKDKGVVIVKPINDLRVVLL